MTPNPHGVGEGPITMGTGADIPFDTTNTKIENPTLITHIYHIKTSMGGA